MVEELLKHNSEIMSSRANSHHRVSNADELKLVTKSIKNDAVKKEESEALKHYV